ncbi:MAG: replicative DNA helicase [Patescibacteria group bacterium]|nr:replicative DNA helicase [Patescibacteria group bacterium]
MAGTQNQKEIEKMPPQNIEAEKSVLGAVMLDQDAIIKIADTINAQDFYVQKNKQIFEVMLELYEKREPIDILSLSNCLENKGTLKELGGSTYLTSLVNSVPSAANILHYAKIVREKATLRRLIQTGQKIVELGYLEEEDLEKLLDKAEQGLFSVSQKYLKHNFIPIQSILTEAFDRIDELHKQKGKLRGLPTGFTDLDNLLAGLQNSDLIVLAARPSMGKTSLALDIARQVATQTKVPVGIFSLEMSKEQLVDRLLCAEAGVDLWKMRTGKIKEDEFPYIGEAMGVLAETPIFLDDSATSNIMEIRTKARRLQMEHKVGLLIIDYLQLMEGRTTDNRVQEVSEISRNLKAIARELNIPVLALSQLSRAVESRSPAIPQLSDLRESGSIEQDADVVIFIYREVMYKRETERANIADIFIKKHRNGPTGQLELYFNENQASFKNLDRQHSELTT